MQRQICLDSRHRASPTALPAFEATVAFMFGVDAGIICIFLLHSVRIIESCSIYALDQSGPWHAVRHRTYIQTFFFRMHADLYSRTWWSLLEKKALQTNMYRQST